MNIKKISTTEQS